ncbi:amino acid ABC transporter substrate-binding protein [Nocardia sp. NPDC051030]|uniref:amino acid ABC transporter substrate-binding protein n=1 Tax=Nocardia sp. NPDC051030 TaxID=3155162 RepID=UPI0034354CB2
MGTINGFRGGVRGLSRAVGISAVIVLVAAGCGSKGAENTADTSGDTLKFGASLSLSGKTAREGQLTKEGYDLCVDQVTKQGGIQVGDRKLKLEIDYQDDTSNPDTAGQIVDRFNDSGVKLLLGPYGTAPTGASMPVVERNSQVMVDSAGADDTLFTHGYRRTFAVLSPASKYAAAIVQAIDELANPKPKSVVFLSADDGFSKTVASGGEDAARKLGWQVLTRQEFPNGTTDVSSALTAIKGQQPDLIIGSVHLAEGIAIIQQSAELGITPASGFGETVAPPTPDFVKTLGDKAENVLSSSQWSSAIGGSDPIFGSAKDYVTAFRAKFGADRTPQYHNAEASAACLAMVLAVQKAGSAAPDKVRDALAALDTQSFFGAIKFNEVGENVVKPMSVIQIQGGKVVPVWPKDQAEGTLAWPARR